MFRQVLDDVRHAGRAMVGMPLLASVVVLSLAVGIGVNAIVFSWMQAARLAAAARGAGGVRRRS